MGRIAQVDDIAEDYYLDARERVLLPDGKISVPALLSLRHARYVLFRLTEEVGLSATALDNLWELLHSGRQLGGRKFSGRHGQVAGRAKWRLEIILNDKSC